MVRSIRPSASNQSVHARDIHDAAPCPGLLQLGRGGLATEEDAGARDAHDALERGERVLLQLNSRTVNSRCAHRMSQRGRWGLGTRSQRTIVDKDVQRAEFCDRLGDYEQERTAQPGPLYPIP